MVYVGIDLGGTNIAAGVVDENYEIIGKASTKTLAPRPAEEICRDMAKVAKQAVEASGVTMEEVAWVGIGSPGTVNSDEGEVEFSNNLEFHHARVRDMMHTMIDKEIYLENDANAAAYGESLAGASKGSLNSVAITLGTGVGGGIIIDGKILSGWNYAGAELGHMVIVKDGRACNCGRRGCWESYASATALIYQTKLSMIENPGSVMWELVGNDINSVNGRTAFDAMRRGDAAGQAVVDRYIGYVACGVSNVINIFQPEILCIGGGISHEGETLLAPLRQIIEQERYSKYSERQTAICAAKLANDAGIIGAAFLGRLKK